jgi:hypothetical protein
MSTPTVSKIKGTGYSQLQTPTMSPQQQQLFSQLFQGGQAGLTGGLNHLNQQAAGGNEEYWQQQEAPALRQFNELQGGLASRFSGMGSGARRSSGFQNTINSSTTDLAERLQGQRHGLQQNAIKQLMDLYGSLMGTNTFDTAFLENKQKKRPFWQELLGSAAGGATSALTSRLGL